MQSPSRVLEDSGRRGCRVGAQDCQGWALVRGLLGRVLSRAGALDTGVRGGASIRSPRPAPWPLRLGHHGHAGITISRKARESLDSALVWFAWGGQGGCLTGPLPTQRETWAPPAARRAAGSRHQCGHCPSRAHRQGLGSLRAQAAPPQDSWGAGVRRGPGTGPSTGHRSRGVRVQPLPVALMPPPCLPGSCVPRGAEGPGQEAEEGAEEGGAQAAARGRHPCGPEPASQALGGRAGPGLPVRVRGLAAVPVGPCCPGRGWVCSWVPSQQMLGPPGWAQETPPPESQRRQQPCRCANSRVQKPLETPGSEFWGGTQFLCEVTGTQRSVHLLPPPGNGVTLSPDVPPAPSGPVSRGSPGRPSKRPDCVFGGTALSR